MIGLGLSDLTPELFSKILDEYDRIFEAWDKGYAETLRNTYMDDIKEVFFDLGMEPGFRLGSVKFATDDSKLFVRLHQAGETDEETIIYFEFSINNRYAEKRWSEELKAAEEDFERTIERILLERKIGVNIDLN